MVATAAPARLLPPPLSPATFSAAGHHHPPPPVIDPLRSINPLSRTSHQVFAAAAMAVSPQFRLRCYAHPSAAVAPPRRPSSGDLPLRKIPGDYGPPFIGAVRDRLAYFYTQGRDEFLRSRIRLHNSTVFRVNMPPGPFIAADSRVIALLDAATFPVLFDTSLVDKRDLFTGTFSPSPSHTGGHRVLSYLDPSEPNHAPLKTLIFFLLSSRRKAIVPEFRSSFADLFSALESRIAADGKADFGPLNDAASFEFLARALLDRAPPAAAPEMITRWVLVQLAPILTLGLPSFPEDLLLRTFRLPAALARRDYGRLAGFFSDSFSPELAGEAKRLGIPFNEAVHNVLFAVCFNSFGGMKILFPAILKWVGRGGGRLHRRLAEEVRSAVSGEGGKVTMRAVEAMPLVKSVVYEVLRLEPPVPMQYGRAKRDMVVESHTAAYEVSAGEVLFGYQPMATRDPVVFGDTAEEFVPERFLGEEGEKLLRHVVWSNGPETEVPMAGNKQCAGKEFVVMVARLLVAEVFLRYDSFDVEVESSVLGSAVRITALRRASF